VGREEIVRRWAKVCRSHSEAVVSPTAADHARLVASQKL